MASISDDEMDLENKEESKGLESPDVVTKYTTASEIANRALELVISRLVPGAVIVQVCTEADQFITDATSRIYNKGKLEKGIAFPTCVSVNNVVGHFSPLDVDQSAVREGDLAKIDLGVHIDGFCAVVAHTIQVGGGPVVGRKADVLAAAHTAAECARRMITPGAKNTDITNMLNKVAGIFNCNVVQAVLSHQMKRFIIDGNNVILSKADAEHKVDEFEFQVGEVYAMDVVMSTGEGKPRESEERTTVFKRALDQNYNLKMKASRFVLSEINSRFPTFPFTTRALQDNRGRLGLVECIKHDLIIPYPVLFERDGEFVAQYKFTVLIMPNNTLRITGLPVDMASIQTEHRVEDPEITAILAKALPGKKKKKKAKKAKQAGEAEAEADDQDMDQA